ncbi:MAG TPA: Uma2 family endonuclease [Gemmata sp.]|nr:Uma2 family endonuclease [Gemmata sp.]
MSTAEMLTPMPELVRDDLENDDHYEIIDGQRVELPPMSAESSVLAARLARVLSNHSIERDLGEAHPEILFKLPLQLDRNRRPDIAFVPYSRWPRSRPIPPTNAWAVLPDLCVEVVSPTDHAEEIETKIKEYFEAGVRLVWVVYPRQEQVYVYDSPGQVRRLSRADTLDGGVVLPEFRLPLADLFLQTPPPPAP